MKKFRKWPGFRPSPIQKLGLKMKLSLILIVAAFFQIQAETGYGQDHDISLDLQSASFLQVIEIIEAQTDYRFFYSREELDLSRTLNIRVQEQSIESVLDAVFDNTDVQYKIIDFQIVLMRKPPTKLPLIRSEKRFHPIDESSPLREESRIQGISIQGLVTDGSGEPLIGVNIQVQGTTQGTATDFEGRFELHNLEPNAILLISYIGYQTQEIPVDGRTEINISMIEDAQTLDELVVVGYGTQKKINLTGAVDVVEGKALTNRQSPTVSQLLQGTSPSLNFSIGNEGFQPGASLGISIRGMGTINGGSPFVLIDGIPGSIDNLNPQDIESISILKDAAASAIYGASAPFGVILISTKMGNKDEKLSVSYSGNTSISIPQPLPKMLDSYTFARVMNEAGNNRGGLQFSPETIKRILAFQNNDWEFLDQDVGPHLHSGASARYGAFPDGTNWNTNVLNYGNNDWWDIYYGHGLNHKHDLSIRGGGKVFSYYFSGGLMNQEGVLNYGEDNFRRLNLLGKLNFDITDWWSLTWESRFSQSRREKPNHLRGSDYTTVFQDISRIYPTTPMYDGFGNYNYESHIPKILNGVSESDEFDYWNNFKIQMTPVQNWRINVDFAFNSDSRLWNKFNPYMYTYLVDNTKIINGLSVPNSLNRNVFMDRFWTLNAYSSYDVINKNKNQLNVLVGTQYTRGRNHSISSEKTDIIVDHVPSFQTSTGSTILSERLSVSATQGYFTRITYNYDERYLFESNARYDGSYAFREGNRWGFFPSFSVGWNVNREFFWTFPDEYVSSLKIRGSWGQLGNHNIVPFSDRELLTYSTNLLPWIYNYSGSRPAGYMLPPSIVNRNLSWEVVTSKNIGVNAGFLSNKLNIDLDIFERNTTNMVGPTEAKPGVIGANVPQSNNASLKTKGWEMSLRWQQNTSRGNNFYVGFNLYNDKSIITDYHNPSGTLSTWYPGMEVGEIWGYTVNDLFRTKEDLDDYIDRVDLSFLGSNWRTGDVKYEDVNNDGKVNNGNFTVDNPGDLSIIGNSQPKYQYGISAGMNLMGFDFSMLLRGVAKRDVYFSYQSNIFWGFGNGQRFNTTITDENLDYFRDEPGTENIGLYEGEANINLNSYFPRPYLNTTEQTKNLNNPNTRYLQSASYLRLHNVQIGYTFKPKAQISKLSFSSLRLYVSGENIFTFSSLPNGIDPIALEGNLRAGEGLGRLTYGADRIFSLGINFNY